ncbi:hypothetical protein ACFL2T_04785, partial [Elusimicrobiota bacterium]
MRKTLSLLLSASITAFSAGLEPYSAWAQLAVEGAVAVRSGVSGAAGAAVPGLGSATEPRSVA